MNGRERFRLPFRLSAKLPLVLGHVNRPTEIAGIAKGDSPRAGYSNIPERGVSEVSTPQT
jgi:hypothetical protein